MYVKKLVFAMITVFSLLALGGCASRYSDIRANGDGTYTVTYTRQGFFRVYGEIYHCKPQGKEKLLCRSIDRL